MPEVSSDKLQEQRDLIEKLFGDWKGFYQQQPAQDLMGQIQGRAAGTDVPFTQPVVDSMMVDNARNAAGGFNRDREMIYQALSAAGLGGSGLGASAVMGASRRAAALAREGRRQITTNAQLQNFQARERAQQQAQSYLAQQQQAQAQQAQSELGYRSQFREIQQEDPQTAQLRQQFSGANPFLKQLGSMSSVGWDPNAGGPLGGGTPFSRGSYTVAGQQFGWDRDRANQALDNKRSSLMAQAADWSAQRDAFLARYPNQSQTPTTYT